MEQKNKELFYKLMTDCKNLIPECPNEKEGKRVLACEYCRFEYLRKAIAKEIFSKVKARLNHLDNEWEISNALYPIEKEYE